MNPESGLLTPGLNCMATDDFKGKFYSPTFKSGNGSTRRHLVCVFQPLDLMGTFALSMTILYIYVGQRETMCLNNIFSMRSSHA